MTTRCECGRVAHANYGFPGQGKKGARWCSECPGKPQEAVNVTVKWCQLRCECGVGLPIYGPVGEGRQAARWCKHKEAADLACRRRHCGLGQPALGLSGKGSKVSRWCTTTMESLKTNLASWASEMGYLVGNALPVFAFNVSQFANNILSQAFIGRLGPKELAASALAISYMTLMCQTIDFGLATGQETVVSQANGAGRYKEVGVCLQRGLIVWFIAQAIMSGVSMFGAEILVSLGQDPELSELAGTYILYSLPTMWGMGLASVLCTWLQAQGIFTVVLALGAPGLALQVAGLMIMVPRVGYLGATYATAASSWASALLFIGYIAWLEFRREPERRTLHGLDLDAINGLLGYVKVALPSFAMVFFEWSAVEVALLMAGTLPGAASGVPTSVSAMVMGVISICYAWSLALSQSASSRVGNTLGEGDGKLARFRGFCAWTAQLVFAACCQLVLFVHRRDWAALFASRDETEEFEEAYKIYPVVAAIIFCDANAALISGVVRGAGLQRAGGILNLSAFYVVGLPLSVLLTFHFDAGLTGIWAGIACGFFAQWMGLGALVAFSDFDVIATGLAVINEEYKERQLVEKGMAQGGSKGSLWRLSCVGLEAPLLVLVNGKDQGGTRSRDISMAARRHSKGSSVASAHGS